MDTLCTIPAAALPPPLPTSPALPPTTPRIPGVAKTAGFIVLYFLLQIAIGFAASLLVAFGLGLQIGFRQGRAGLADIGHQVQTMLMQPDMQAALTMLTLIGAAWVVLRLARRKWPQLWSMARPPGFGFVMPVQPAFFVMAIAVGLAAPMLGGWMTRLFAGHHAAPQNIQQLGTQAGVVSRLCLALLLVSLGPLVEELLFRGMLLSALMRRWHVGWAVTVSSLAFVLIHLPGLQLHWYALPDLFLLALALCWVRLQSGSIWPAVLTHSLNNALAVLAWFITIKPG
jgi:membrane protease YdiL (CAAX protease family)